MVSSSGPTEFSSVRAVPLRSQLREREKLFAAFSGTRRISYFTIDNVSSSDLRSFSGVRGVDESGPFHRPIGPQRQRNQLDIFILQDPQHNGIYCNCEEHDSSEEVLSTIFSRKWPNLSFPRAPSFPRIYEKINASRLVGDYLGQLSNSAERLVLLNSTGGEVASIESARDHRLS